MGLRAAGQPPAGRARLPDSLRTALAAPRNSAARLPVLLRVVQELARHRHPATTATARRAVALAHTLGDSARLGQVLVTWAGYVQESEDNATAARLLARAAPLLVGQPDTLRAPYFYCQGLVASAQGQQPAVARRAFATASRLATPAFRVEVWMGLANHYITQDQLDSASIVLQRALRSAERSPDSTQLSGVLANLATVYYLRQRDAEALPLARRSLRLQRRTTDSAAIADCLILLGELTGQFRRPEALAHLREAYLIRRRLGLVGELGQSAQFLGIEFTRQNAPDSAIFYYQKAVRQQQAQGQPDAANSMRLLAEVYLERRQWAPAARWAALALADSATNPMASTYMARALAVLGAVASQRGDYRLALDYLQRQRATERRQQARTNERLVEELRVSFATEEAEQVAALASERAAHQQTRARRLTWAVAGLTLGLAALALLIGLLARARRRQLATEAALRRADATKDRLMGIIGHDLRGPVADFQQAMPLVRHLAYHPDPAELAGLADDLETRAHHLAALLDNLLHWARTQRDEVRNRPEAVPVAPLLTDVQQLYAPRAVSKRLTLTVEVLPAAGAPLTAHADPALLATVLRNLTANALKFTPADGAVTLAAEPTPDGRGVRFTVKDTGVGMTASQLADLFAPRAARSTPGTAGEGGTGLGLLVSHHFVQLLGGELTVQSALGQGTIFMFAVPTFLTN